MGRTVAALVAVAMTAAACGGAAGDGPDGAVVPDGDGPDVAAVPDGDGLLPLCRDLVPVTPDPSDLRDTPVYIGNEQPDEEVRDWARRQPGYEELWIDRDHNGWLVVGFSEGVDAARAGVAEEFPDDGVVVVEVPRPQGELLALQEQVHERSALVQGSSSDVRTGHVRVFVPFVTDEVHQELSDEFAGEPVCVDGGDPADAPAAGPQATDGDGWRLLAAEQGSAAYAYRTGIATTSEQVAAALDTLELGDREVDVDLQTEVLVWFGEAHGSGCTERRLDGITVTDGDEPVLRPQIVDPGGSGFCTSDLVGAWAFVVAVDRSSLPTGPFTIRLTDGAPIQDEATFVDADLSRPGATVDAEDLGTPAPDPKDRAAGDGSMVEPGFPVPYVLYVHCGVGALGTLNDVFWVSEDESLRYGPVPDQWRDLVDEDEEVVVEVLLETGDPPTATATANGYSVTYVPGAPDQYGCD